MINFNNIKVAANKLQAKPNEIFNLATPNKQSVIVYEDADLIVSLILSKQAQNRHLYTTIKFKKYKTIEKDSSLLVKIDSTKSIKDNLENITIESMVETCINTCNINGLDEVNFIKNGYSLEVVKTSNRYVTISEYINAVPFEKRFESLENLFNYINYRKSFHTKINIGLNVSETELSNIKRNIQVLKENAENVLSTMLLHILGSRTSKIIDISQISFQNIRRVQNNILFDVVFDNESGETSLSCVYNNIVGMHTSIKNDELASSDIYNLQMLLYVINQIETSYSGHFEQYVNLTLQHSKFKSKITSVDVSTKIKQMKPSDIKDKIVKSLVNAKANEEMISEQVVITSFGGYKRYIVLDGVMKNRRRCALVVYTERKGNVFEEYQIAVEKNRINEEARDFLNQYFI